MPDNISVGGLASGLDTNAIIEGLVRIEMRRVEQALEKKKGYELKLGKFGELQAKLAELGDKAKGLEKITAFNLFKSTTSNNDIATIDGSTDANAGNYDVKVQGLASSLKVASKSFGSQVNALGLSGSFTLSMSKASLKADPSVTSVQVDIAATDSLKDIAAKINRAKGSGATASVVQMGPGDYRLMVSSVDEGTKAFTLGKVGATTLLTTGLDLVTENQSMRTAFDLRLAAGGAASAATTFDQVFRGIGQSYQTGDVISWTGTDSAGNDISGSFNLNLGDAAADGVDDMLTAVQAALDAAAPGRTTASLNSSGEIVFTDNASGGAQNFAFAMQVNGTSLGEGQGRTDFKNVISTGKKAFYLLNDLPVSSLSNLDDMTVVGTRIHLKKADPTETVKLTLDRDPDKVMEKVRDFLVAYNGVIKFINDQSKVEIKDKQEGSILDRLNGDKNQSTVQRGPFAGDSSILGLKQQIQNLVTSRIPELTEQGLSQYSSLAAVGITTKRNDGTLDIDEEKFKDALDVDFEGVRRLFVTFGYSGNPAFEYGTATKDTKTGVYNLNTGTGQFDKKRGAADIAYAAGVVTGDSNVLNSEAGDSKGLAVKYSGAAAGQFTFIRGIAGQVNLWHQQLNDFVNGFASETKKSLDRRIKDEQGRVEKLEDQVDKFRNRLIAQFSNLERSIARLQAQSGAFQNSAAGFLRR